MPCNKFKGQPSKTCATELTDKFLEFNVFATSSSVTDASEVCRQIFVNGYAIDAIIDTGADCNVLPKDCVPPFNSYANNYDY